MLIFGIDVALVEIVFIMGIITIILLIESLIIISLMVSQMRKTKNIGLLLERLSQVLLEIKKAEIQELDMIKGRK
ncbi:MAG: hypothetical protein AABX05_01270 [Nanoarchaeota archaeon]